jgi:hypothetical protein
MTNINLSNNNDIFTHPVLAFTPSGQPRALTERVTGGNVEPSLNYLACDVDCTSASNWSELALGPRGSGTNPSWALKINAQGGLRVAFYQGWTTTADSQQLYYVWCDSDCLNPNSWFQQALLTNPDGENPDLALDTQGRPRIAYNMPGGKGLGYVWCDTACDTAAGWSTTVAESSALLDATFPLPTNPVCTRVSWAGAGQARIALDAAGNAYVGYVAQRLVRCLSSTTTPPGTPPSTYVSQLRYARFSFFPQP